MRCRANTTPANPVAMTRGMETERLEYEREAVLQLRKRRGLFHLHREEKEGIIDESAAHNQTSGEITHFRDQWRWTEAKHETETLLHTCAPATQRTRQGTLISVLSTLFRALRCVCVCVARLGLCADT